MSISYINAELRRHVIHRARHQCEYCLIHEEDMYWGCQIDHIISEKHGGETVAENLACACAVCNRNKGSDVGSIIIGTNQFVRFYNPRVDRWDDHFRLDDAQIVGLTDIGDATIRILDINNIERIIERQVLIELNRYP